MDLKDLLRIKGQTRLSLISQLDISGCLFYLLSFRVTLISPPHLHRCHTNKNKETPKQTGVCLSEQLAAKTLMWSIADLSTNTTILIHKEVDKAMTNKPFSCNITLQFSHFCSNVA